MSEINELLNKKMFLIRKHVSTPSISNDYNIIDTETNEIILTCHEPYLSKLNKFFRRSDFKRLTPFDIIITTNDNQQVVRARRRVMALLSSRVKVFDDKNKKIGVLKQRYFSVGGDFIILDPKDKTALSLKGDHLGWNFGFMLGDIEIAHVTKKWNKLEKEIRPNADSYLVEITNMVKPPIRSLILISVIYIDMVLRE